MSHLPPRPPDWRSRLRARLQPENGIPFMTRGARYSVVFLFVLSFLLAGGSYWLSASAARNAVANRASVVQLCEAGNESRAQQVTLWTRLVAISQPPPHETAAERRQRAKTIRVFIAYVRKLFAKRDCATRFSG
jgi:hypothetical protein